MLYQEVIPNSLLFTFKDENVVKKHYHLKKLMKLKEQGFVIDTSSERALKKKRLGIKLKTFSLEENKGKFGK